MSVFGNVWGTTGTTVAVYDVRFGVASTTGALGTLTSPAESQVESGVQYGGSGTQYTGTLVTGCPAIDTGTSWTDDMGDTFTDLVAEFGSEQLVYINNLGTTCRIDCVKTELAMAYEMQISGSNRLVNTAIDVRRADAIMVGLYLPEWSNNPPVKRPIVLVRDVKFQVVEWKDDIESDPTIKLICAKLQ